MAASPEELRVEEMRVLGSGTEEAQFQSYMPFTRTFSASGIVSGSLAASAAAAGVPAAALIEALAALGAGIDLERELRDGDRFYVRYERGFTAAGDPIGVGKVLWAELSTEAKGTVSIHRFRTGKPAVERFWLATGQAVAPPEIRLPLQKIAVSSGFGLRADPFDQPGRGWGPAMKAVAGKGTGGAQPSPLSGPPAPIGAGVPFGSFGGGLPKGVGPNQPAAKGAGGPRPSPLSKATVPIGAGVPFGSFGGSLPNGVVPKPAAAMTMHEGVDLAAEMGAPVRAAGDGVVVGAELKGGYGNWIEIEHDGAAGGGGSLDGFKRPTRLSTVYGHLSGFADGIVAGTRVKQGEVIGFVGSTGRSTGPHLHFEILSNGKPTNPMINLALRPDQLRGGELERFRKTVARDLQERQREAGSI
jgi:murein DD-endopeptidase MepM/ murein hydrolase activator NlpD